MFYETPVFRTSFYEQFIHVHCDEAGRLALLGEDFGIPSIFLSILIPNFDIYGRT